MANVSVRNSADYARTFHNPITGEGVRLEPGLNTVDGDLLERVAQGNSRLEAFLESGTISMDEEEGIKRLVREVEDGREISDIVPARDAINVVRAINDITTLKELYRQSNRVSVRTEIVKRLRALGFMQNDI